MTSHHALRAALETGDPALVAGALHGVDVLVSVMSASPGSDIALFERRDGGRALYAFSSPQTLADWALQTDDDGGHQIVAGASLGELALEQGADDVALDAGAPHALGLSTMTAALLLAGHAGTVVSPTVRVPPANGPDAEAVAGALTGVLEWSPVRSAWLFERTAGGEQVLTVAMGGVNFDGAVARCQQAAPRIPQGVPVDVIAVDDEQEAWLAAELPDARLGRRGGSVTSRLGPDR